MGYFNLKRLVVVFLMLAIVASTSAFLFSSNSGKNQSPVKEKTASKKESAKAPESAFIESLPEPPQAAAYAAEDGLPPITQTDNLTEKLAQHLAREMVANNPQGPKTADGLSLIVPEIEPIADKIYQNSANLSLDIARNATVAISDKDIKILSQYTPKDIAAYAETINSIASKNLSLAQLEWITKNFSQTTETLNALQLTIESAIIQAKKTEVPAPFAELHKSFLQILAYQKKFLDLANETNDPLRADLILDAAAQNHDKAIIKFYFEMEKIDPRDLSLGAGGGGLAAILGVLSPIQTANAFSLFGITLSFDPWQFGVAVKNFVKSIIVDITKNRIIHELVNQVIRWVQGGGKPQFVTNWRAFLDDAANKAAGDVIYKLAPQMCRSFGPLVRIALTVTPPLESPVFCTLDQVVSNFQQFFDSFQNGGWIAYTTLLEPQNNLFGALMIASDIVAENASKAKEAAEKEASTAGGFTPQKLCAKEEYRNKRQQCIFENPNNPKACNLIPDVTYKECVAYQVTNPGSVTQQITVAALNSPISRIVNAEDISALVGAFVNSAMNKLIQLGKKGIAGLFSGGAEASTLSKTGLANTCEDLEGKELKACIRALKRACNDAEGDLRSQCFSEIPEEPTEEESAACTITTPPSADALPLPDKFSVVQEAAGELAEQFLNSCQNQGGNWEFMDELVRRLHQEDPRFGYNGKRGNVNDISQDAIAYYFGAGNPENGSPDVYVIDVIEGHCGPTPRPAWQNVSCFDPGAGAAYVYPRQ